MNTLQIDQGAFREKMDRRGFLGYGLAAVGGVATVGVLNGTALADNFSTPQNISNWINVKDFGAIGDGKHADGLAIQQAINTQQEEGGVVYVPSGTYLLSDVPWLVAAPWPHDAIRPLSMRGDGMGLTTLKAGTASGDIFLYGKNGRNPVIAQMFLSDMTLDGNYKGVQGEDLSLNRLTGRW